MGDMEVQEGGCGRVERLNRRTDIYKDIKPTQRSAERSFRFLSDFCFNKFKQNLDNLRKG
jgi:hypothetical protein